MKAMKKLLLSLSLTALFAVGMLVGANTFGQPQTVLHVITVKFKADSTPAQQQAALDGVRKMASEVPGIKNVWLKKIKVQPADFSTVIAMEFESKAAFEAYTLSPAHKAWEAVYLPIREQSTTHDVTN